MATPVKAPLKLGVLGVEEGEQMSEEGADSFNTLFGEGQEEEQADGEEGLIGEEEERGEQPGGGIRVPDHPRGGRGVYEKDGEEGQAVPADADPYLAGGAVLEVRMLPALQLLWAGLAASRQEGHAGVASCTVHAAVNRCGSPAISLLCLLWHRATAARGKGGQEGRRRSTSATSGEGWALQQGRACIGSQHIC